MDIEDKILNKLGKILIESAPLEAKKIIMKAEPNFDGDVCQYQFNYIKKNSENYEYDPDGIATLDILDVLVELRKFHLDANSSEIWSGCIVTVDIEHSKINIEFKYEPFIGQ